MPFKDPRENFNAIRFLPGCGQPALTRTSSVELLLDFLDVDSQAGRAAVYDYADSAAVGFAKCRDSESFSETTAHVFHPRIRRVSLP